MAGAADDFDLKTIMDLFNKGEVSELVLQSKLRTFVEEADMEQAPSLSFFIALEPGFE